MLALLLESARKRSLTDLFSENPTDYPAFVFGETMPVQVSRVEKIANPTTTKLFQPLDSTGWDFQIGLGLGFQAPVAGSYYIASGIALTSGTVTSGRRFKIIDFNSGDNFTNIGAGSNATGVIFTASGTTPTTWSNGSELQEITANIDYDADAATIETALNATAWITAAGGVTVEAIEDSATFFAITFDEAGARTEMVGSSDNLAPDSTVDLGTWVNGSTELAEVQTMRVSQSPATWADLDDNLEAAGITISEVQAGDATHNHKVRITLDPLPYDGQFSITIRGIESAMLSADASEADVVAALEDLEQTSGILVTGAKYKIVSFAAGDSFTNVGAASNATGVVFVASGTTPTTWTNSSILSPVGEGNVSVSKEAPGQYLIALQGDMALTAMGTFTADDSGLLVLTGKSGELPMDVPGVELLLGDDTSRDVTLQVRGRADIADEWQILLTETVSITRGIFTPGSETPQPRATYYTRDEIDALLASILSGGNILIGTKARLVPIANGMKIQVSTDGSTWQDAESYSAS